jgi:integrase/recombinase XerD
MRSGPLFTRIYRSGKVTLDRLTAQTVMDVLKARAAEAGTAPASPHDLRRTYASTLLADPETGVVVVSRLMGHADVSTTALYDRRPAEAAAAAARRLPDPFAR